MIGKFAAVLILNLTLMSGNAAHCAVRDTSASPGIVVDQFGYVPNARKIAVIRVPKVGYDAGTGREPSANIQLLKSKNNQLVYSERPLRWNDAGIDPMSGDSVWWFDFSSVSTPGTYYVFDPRTNVRSPSFVIGADVYRKVLVQAVRAFFYQRSGFAKDAKYAGKAWADNASHLQDKYARRFMDKNDVNAERDLQGGWYDAGDYNKYTAWTCDYIVNLLRAYAEAPTAFGDDTNIPESGNGVPDVVDEVQWGLEWLKRMQQKDGSVLSIVGAASASPPSRAYGKSFYGDPNTISALAAATAFAYTSKVFSGMAGQRFTDAAKDFMRRAELSYTWAEANPHVIFKNNDRASGTEGLGAGQQEVEDGQRLLVKLEAACYLFEITGNQKYHLFFLENYQLLPVMQNHYISSYDERIAEILLYYSMLPNADHVAKLRIRDVFSNAMASGDHFPAFSSRKDPYMAHIPSYTWGSNSTKSMEGLLYLDFARYKIDSRRDPEAASNAESYLHYLHGTNPLGLVYLSNMASFGATKSVSSFYHTWFCEESPMWGRTTATTPGPAPGFLTGGPNPAFKLSECCPNNCGNAATNAKCTSEVMSPPLGQPPMKAYKDFNGGWPLDSWELTENSNSYQVRYIRLLSRFVK